MLGPTRATEQAFEISLKQRSKSSQVFRHRLLAAGLRKHPVNRWHRQHACRVYEGMKRTIVDGIYKGIKKIAMGSSSLVCAITWGRQYRCSYSSPCCPVCYVVLSSFSPASVISLLHASSPLMFGLPILLVLAMSTTSTHLIMCPSFILITWSYRFSCFSVIFLNSCTILVAPLMLISDLFSPRHFANSSQHPNLIYF